MADGSTFFRHCYFPLHFPTYTAYVTNEFEMEMSNFVNRDAVTPINIYKTI